MRSPSRTEQTREQLKQLFGLTGYWTRNELGTQAMGVLIFCYRIHMSRSLWQAVFPYLDWAIDWSPKERECTMQLSIKLNFWSFLPPSFSIKRLVAKKTGSNKISYIALYHVINVCTCQSLHGTIEWSIYHSNIWAHELPCTWLAGSKQF